MPKKGTPFGDLCWEIYDRQSAMRPGWATKRARARGGAGWQRQRRQRAAVVKVGLEQDRAATRTLKQAV